MPSGVGTCRSLVRTMTGPPCRQGRRTCSLTARCSESDRSAAPGTAAEPCRIALTNVATCGSIVSSAGFDDAISGYIPLMS